MTLLILLASAILTPCFYYIPKATLSAVVICAVIFMIEYEAALTIYRSSRFDLISGMGTLIVSLIFGIELGLLFGVIIDIVRLLHSNARPEISFEKKTVTGNDFQMVTPRSSLLFPSAGFLYQKVISELTKVENKDSKVIVAFNFTYVSHIDYTCAQGLNNVMNYLTSKGKPNILFNVKQTVLNKLIPIMPHHVFVEHLEDFNLDLLKDAEKHQEV